MLNDGLLDRRSSTVPICFDTFYDDITKVSNRSTYLSVEKVVSEVAVMIEV